MQRPIEPQEERLESTTAKAAEANADCPTTASQYQPCANGRSGAKYRTNSISTGASTTSTSEGRGRPVGSVARIVALVDPRMEI